MRNTNARWWFAVMAFAASIASAAPALEPRDDVGSKALAGTWMGTVTPNPGDPDAPPPFSALMTFTSDGNFVFTESDEQTITQGVWAKSGPRQFSLTGYQFEFDTPNVWGGTFKVRAKLTVDTDAMHFGGPYHVDFYDTHGNLLFGGDGTVAGAHVDVEPMP